MGLSQYKTLILVLTTVLSLLIASPTIQQILVYPQTGTMTEFWMFGPNHDASYTSNVTADQTYHIFLDVTNHLGSTEYYTVEVKFLNQTQSGPDSFNHTSSNSPSLGTLPILAADNATEEIPLDISFQYHVDADSTKLYMENVTLDGFAIDASATTITWDKAKNGFYGNIVFELWIYNGTTNAFQYHQRYLSLWVKMNP